MNVIITFTFCCDNLWKSKFMALEKPRKLREFFLLLYGHPVALSAIQLSLVINIHQFILAEKYIQICR